MKPLQVSVACLLLKLGFGSIAAAKCEPCKEGQYMVKNCTTGDDGWKPGILCRDCTNCSATNQETWIQCRMDADSVCRNLTTTPSVKVTVVEPEVWMVFSGIVLWLVALVLLTLCFVLLYHQRYPKNYGAGGLSHV